MGPYNNEVTVPSGAGSNNFTGIYRAAILCDSSLAGLSGFPNHAIAGKKFFSRAELTNSPLNNLAQDGVITSNDRFVRDVDGTFQGE